MSRKSRFLVPLIFAGIVSSTFLLAQQQRWLDRFLSKEPQVVSGSPAKPLVEPPASVLALQDAFAKVAESAKPAVVNIASVQVMRVEDQPNEFFYGDPDDFFRRFFGEQGPQSRARPRELRREGTGSGVIIDPEGFILTNNHVVQGADQLTVTLSNDKTYKGKVVGTDARTDLAVIRIRSNAPLPFVPLGDSAKARVGDWVLTIGSPFGLQQTVTSGIISAIRQSLSIEGKSFRNLLQTDAAINRGNSGGAMVNLRGELIGINTAIYAPTGVFSGIGFAIPVNDAKAVLKDLIEKGFVERSWMGVEIAPVDDVIAHQFGLSSTNGAIVNDVVQGSPAERAGLQRGDVIVEFNGVKTTTVQSLQDLVAATPAGKTIPVRVMRDGKSKTLSLKTEAMPKETAKNEEGEEEQPAPAPEKTVQWLGAKFSDLSSQVREQFGLRKDDASAGAGVIAVEVPPESVAADAGLQEGDIVRAVNQVRIAGTADLKKRAKDFDAKKGLVLDVVRQGRSFYLSYKSLQ